jgi:TolA-binding protein
VKPIILIGLVGSFLLASSVSAQQPGRQHGDTANAVRGRTMNGEMTMSTMDSADARLDQLVSTMNKTTGSSKVQAMAAVINELMTQRKMMRRHARQMMGPDGMMGNGMGEGRKMQNPTPPSANPAPSPAGPDTTDHAQHHQP